MFPIGAGNWNNASDAGVFYRNWNDYRSNDNTNNGFRVAFPDSVSSLTALPGRLETKGALYPGVIAEISQAARSSIEGLAYRDRPRSPFSPSHPNASAPLSRARYA